MSKSKVLKNWRSRTSFRSWDVEKVHAVVARSTFPSQNVKSTTCSDHFWFRVASKGLCTLSNVSKTWWFCSSFKSVGRRGAFWEDLQRSIFRGKRDARDMFFRDVRRSRRWFPERGCILEHQIFGFAKMVLRERCSTSYDLASLFHGRRSTLDRWNGKIAKCIGTRPSALHSTFHFWRMSCRSASFLMLSTLKIDKLRKSRRLAAFLMLSNSKNQEVSQNSFVLKFADRQTDRQTDR